MKQFLISITGLPVLFGQVFGCAQTAMADPGADIDEIVVTATRLSERLDQIGFSVTVLTGAMIKASQAQAVSDLLAQTPGVNFARNGGVGETTAVYIRGAESSQTVVLVDGVKLNDPSQPDGGFDFANLLVGDISRIEVLRGPQSTLWGSQAIGGVVNIITASPSKLFEGTVQAEGGSNATADMRAGVGGVDGQLSWRIAGNYYDTRGIPALDRTFGGTEPDGYWNHGFNGRASYDFTDTVQLDERAYLVDAKSDFDGYPPPDYELSNYTNYRLTHEFVDYSGLNVNLFGGAFKNVIAFQYAHTGSGFYDPHLSVPQTFEGIGTNYRFEYQGAWEVTPGYQALFGAEREVSHFTADSPSPFDPAPIPTKALAFINSGYARLQAEVVRGLTLTGGIRFDDQSTYGGRVSVQAAAAWALNDHNTIVRASFGQGFKAPSLYELFSDYGNAALQPEKSIGWDAGVEQHLWDKRIMLSATYFGRVSSDLIDFFDCTNSDPLCASRPFGYYANIDRTRASGIEFQGSAKLASNLVASANYTYADAKDISRSSSTYGFDLPRRPQNTANASISYTWPVNITTIVAAHYASSSYDDAANTILLKGYVIVDLRASYPINHTLEIYGRIENLFDAHYETAYMYGTLGRAIYGGIRARF